MQRGVIFVLSLTFGSLLANPSAEDDRLQRLYRSFMAPCCWRQNLTVHQSPEAEQLRSAIASMVAAGRSDDEIRAELISRYSVRILSMPPGAAGEWLRWTPVAVAVGGLAAVYCFIRRMKLKADREVPAFAGAIPDITDDE